MFSGEKYFSPLCLVRVPRTGLVTPCLQEAVFPAFILSLPNVHAAYAARAEAPFSIFVSGTTATQEAESYSAGTRP